MYNLIDYGNKYIEKNLIEEEKRRRGFEEEDEDS